MKFFQKAFLTYNLIFLHNYPLRQTILFYTNIIPFIWYKKEYKIQIFLRCTLCQGHFRLELSVITFKELIKQ